MSEAATKPEFTQSMIMHVNGGNKFSELRYRIHRDGKETETVRVTRTNGSPRYIITGDIFMHGDETFDIREHGMAKALEWLAARRQGASDA